MDMIDKTYEKILAGISNQKKAFDTEKEKLKRLVDAFDDFTNKRTDLGLQMGKISGQITKAISEGKDQTKFLKEQRELKIEIDQLDSLIEELQTVSIPAQTTNIGKAQDALRTVLHEVASAEKREIRQAFEDKIQEAIDLQENWGQVLGKIRSTIIGISDNGEEVKTFVFLPATQSNLWSLVRLVGGA